jgi:hypothetical protein
MEDEAGMINAIVRPDVYERDRVAIRGEPFLWVLGTLAKDDGTVNIIAKHVRPLKLRKSNGARPERTARGGYRREKLIAALPNSSAADSPGAGAHSPYKFLKQLRRNAPSAKSWG